jgi:DNA-binding response OmpR family regulator
MNKKILVIDDDEKLGRLLRDYLARYEFTVTCHTHPQAGIKALKKDNYDLIILDVMLPDMDGFEVCRTIRRDHTIPIIMLTARGEVTDRIVGLELGADDYLPKPFEPRELVARIQTILRRSRQDDKQESRRFGDLFIHFNRHQVSLNDQPVELTSAEFEILQMFCRRPGITFSRSQILDQLWRLDWDSESRSVDVLISRLRQKLGDDPKTPRYIRTVWGSGYMFVAEE